MKHFEMAHSDNPEAIVSATQRAIIAELRRIVTDLKENANIKQPGLTWEQIDYLLERFGKKKPEIIVQREEM